MRKSHKMILSLYIVLLMTLSMFCLHCKAYTISNSVVEYRFHWSRSDGANSRIAGIDWNANDANDARSIVLLSDDVEEMAREYYGDNYFIEHTRKYCFILAYKGSLNYVPIINHMSANTFIQSEEVRSIMGVTEQQSQYIYCEIVPQVYNNAGENITETNNYYGVNFGGERHEDWQYVTSLKDAKKYLIDGVDSVATVGDPNEYNDVVDENGNIPTPQGVKLYNDGQCVGLVWDNPKMINKLVGKYGDVSVEIKFRPTLNYNLDLFRSKTLTPNDYIGGITTPLSDHGSLYNGFMTLFSNSSTISNKLDKYNIKFDDKYIFTDNILDTDYANVVCKMLGHTLWYVPDSLLDAVLPARSGSLPANTLAGELTDKKNKGVKVGEGGNALDAGLKVLDSLGNLSDFVSNVKELMNNVTVGHSDYMIRYYIRDGNKKICSKWVNVNQTYDDNADATDEQSTNFKDVEDNPVDNPNYKYPSSISSSTVTGDSWWIHFDDSTKTVFDSLSEQMEQLTESDGGFMQFFGELFNTFPWLTGIFALALSIALFLRIFGR